MEPEEYSEYFEDTILSRTPKPGQKGCSAKISGCGCIRNRWWMVSAIHAKTQNLAR